MHPLKAFIICPSFVVIYSIGDIMGGTFIVRFKSVFLAILVAVLSVLIIVLPSGAIGAKKGLTLCFSTIVPSLFLFCALSLFAAYSGVAKTLGKPLSPISKALFGLNGEEFSIFLLSLFSGYPVGAKLLSKTYENGGAGRKKALLMLGFCINAGPAFIVIAVGQIMLGSKADGYRLLLAHILSSFLLALFLSPFLKRNWEEENRLPETQRSALPDCFVKSVSDAANSIISVCAFVVLFSALGEIVSSLPLPISIAKWVRSLLEITVGINALNRKHLSLIAFLLGFSGVSVQFQAMAAAKNLEPRYSFIVLSRTIHGVLSSVWIEIMEKLWPRSLKTSVPPGSVSAALSGDVSASVALVLMGVVLAAFTLSNQIKMKHSPSNTFTP